MLILNKSNTGIDDDELLYWNSFSLNSSLDHCQRSSSLQISNTPRAGLEPVQILNSGFVEWSCVVVITNTPRRHIHRHDATGIPYYCFLKIFSSSYFKCIIYTEGKSDTVTKVFLYISMISLCIIPKYAIVISKFKEWFYIGFQIWKRCRTWTNSKRRHRLGQFHHLKFQMLFYQNKTKIKIVTFHPYGTI